MAIQWLTDNFWYICLGAFAWGVVDQLMTNYDNCTAELKQFVKRIDTIHDFKASSTRIIQPLEQIASHPVSREPEH